MEHDLHFTLIDHQGAEALDRESKAKRRLTTSHVRASHAAKWEGRLRDVVAHADSSTISLINTIDEEVGESRMSAS